MRKKTTTKKSAPPPPSAEAACNAITKIETTADVKPPLTNTEVLKATAKAISDENFKKLQELQKRQRELANQIIQFKVDAAITKIRSATDEELDIAIRRDDCVHSDQCNLSHLIYVAREWSDKGEHYTSPRFLVKASAQDGKTLKTLGAEFSEINKSIEGVAAKRIPHNNRDGYITYNLCDADHVFALLKRNQQAAKVEKEDRTDKIIADPELRAALIKAGEKLLAFTPANHNAIEA